MFDIPVKRKPAPRLFCDICDVFDEHDTEDCPIQSSESSPLHTTAQSSSTTDENGTKKRVLPPPRKYCESCEGIALSINKTMESTTESIFFFVHSFWSRRRRMRYGRNILNTTQTSNESTDSYQNPSQNVHDSMQFTQLTA